MTQLATITNKTQIARPLKILVPLIQGELQMGNSAGREHYRLAGEMLIEAKDQLAHGAWGKWLAKNFDLSASTAKRYIRWAELHENDHSVSELPTSLRAMDGSTQRAREERQSKQQQSFRTKLRDVAREDFVQERQSRDDEVQLHRELAAELVDIGYRALATKLHPDRGGAKEAMARLNRVRDELKQLAQTRRFI